MATVGRQRTQFRWALGLALVASAKTAPAQPAPAQPAPAQPAPAASAPYPSPYQYPAPYQPPPLRLRLSGSRNDLFYRLRSQPEREDETVCRGDCELVLTPGNYRLEVQPPDGTGLRRVTKNLELQRDTRIHVAPGDRAARGWGLGLTITGGLALSLGLVPLFFNGWPEDDTGDQILIASLVGGGALATASGITLLVMGRNRVTVDPPPLRALASRPVMLRWQTDL